MNKKGFTLVEMLAIIVVLIVIALVSFPSLVKTIKDSTEDQYNEAVNNIILAAQSMNSIYNGILSQVPVSSLKEYGYLTGKQTNPIDNTELNGCVFIDDGYYTYKETECAFVYVEYLNVNANLSTSTLVGKNVAIKGKRYTATITANTGSSLPTSISVVQGLVSLTAGVDYTYDNTTGALTINNVKDTITITG